MTKTKILAFIAIAAIFSACASDDDSAPPKLLNAYPNTISPFDTLVVKFDSKLVGLDTTGESNVVLGNGKIWVNRKTSAKELYFIGANRTTADAGSYYFTGGRSDSIEFKNIKNSDYKTNRTVFYFSTHKILDIEANNIQKDANDIESPGDSITKTNAVTFTGVIDKYMGIGADGFKKEDESDFYKFNSKRDDIISITVTNKNTPLKVRFFGPCYTINKSLCNDKTDSTTSKNKYSVTLIDTVKVGHEQESVGEISPFYIDIFENTNDKPNPYIVTVKKL